MTAQPYSLPTFPTWHVATPTASAGRHVGTDTGLPGRTVRAGHMAGSHGANGNVCTDCISPHPKGGQGGDAHAGPLMAPGNAGWSMCTYRPGCGAVRPHARSCGACVVWPVGTHGLLVSPGRVSIAAAVAPRSSGSEGIGRHWRRQRWAYGPDGHITPRDCRAKLDAQSPSQEASNGRWTPFFASVGGADRRPG